MPWLFIFLILPQMPLLKRFIEIAISNSLWFIFTDSDFMSDPTEIRSKTHDIFCTTLMPRVISCL